MGLSIQTSNTNLAFKSNTLYENEPTIVDKGSYYEKIYTTEASTGKKWGVGLASAFCPGLGQAINGQWGKGIGFFLGTGALYIASVMSGALGITSRNPNKGIAGMIALLLATLGLQITSIVDAVKSAKGEIKQIVPKEQSKVDVNA